MEFIRRSAGPLFGVSSVRQQLRVVRLSSVEEMGALRAAWNAMSPLHFPSHQFIWTYHAACTLAPKEMSLFVVLERGTPVAAAPLVEKNGRLELLGMRELGEPADLLFRDTAALEMLLREVLREGKTLVLGRLPSESSVPVVLQKVLRRRGVLRQAKQAPYPYIRFEEEPPETQYSARLRADLRRARRKAEKLGEVQLEMNEPRDVRTFQRLFHALLEVEASGWKGRGRTALKADGRRRNFFEQYGLNAARLGQLRMAFLRIAGEPAAAQFAVQAGGSYWLLKIGYDERFACCSPGMLLMDETLRYGWQQSLQTYELLGRSDEWTRRWPTLERETISVSVYPFTVSGLREMGTDAAGYAAGRIKRGLGWG